jgi:Arc/MetJ-type ribon-helix-helix transcriptional regulator
MSTIPINLPDDLKKYVESESSRRGYENASEFVQAVLEAEKMRDLRKELEQSLLDAMKEPSTPMTAQDFEDVRRRGLAIIKQRQGQ